MAKAAKTKPVAATKAKGPSLKMIEFTAAAIKDAIAATGAKKSGKLLLVPLDQITEAPGFNLRIDNEKYRAGIAKLAKSIEAEGFYESHPLSGFAAEIDGAAKIVVIDGHRRFQALQQLAANGFEFDGIPVVLKPGDADSLDLAVALDKENSAEELSMLERAVLAKRMLTAGLARKEIADRLDCSERHVGDLLVLIDAPKAIRDLVRDGKIAAYEAIAKMRKEGGADKILEAAAKADELAAEKAEKATKLTKTTLETGGVKPPKLQVFKMNFKATAGSPFEYEDVEPFLGLLGDEDWFKPVRKKSQRMALSDMQIEVTIRRPKTDTEVEAEADSKVAADAAKPPKAGRKQPAADPDLDDDDGGLGDDDGAVDLRALGIAEPANAEM